MTGHIHFHLPAEALWSPETRMAPFYRQLTEGLRDRGITVGWLRHDRHTVADTVAAGENDFHILDHGRLRHPRVLNAGLSYAYPFWNLDPWGIRALSSIAAREFRPETIDGPTAEGFHRRLHARLAEGRTSRIGQPEEQAEFPPGVIAVFLQSRNHRDAAATGHLDQDQLIEGLLARPDPRPIVVKLHPRDPDAAETRARLAALGDPRLTVTGANLHDILARAAVTVTITSGAGMESLVHRVPLVLAGATDFHHCAVTARDPAELDAAMAEAETRDWPYSAFLYWYFRRNCLSSGSPRLIDDFLARLAATGYDLRRLTG